MIIQVLDAAVFLDKLPRAFGADARHAGDAVGGIPLDGLEVDHLPGGYAVFLHDFPFVVQRHLGLAEFRGGKAHAGAAGHKLQAVPVSCGNEALVALLLAGGGKGAQDIVGLPPLAGDDMADRKSTRLNSQSQQEISYAVFCLGFQDSHKMIQYRQSARRSARPASRGTALPPRRRFLGLVLPGTSSDNLAHKCCKFAKIRSQAKHYKYRKPGDEHLEFNNIIKGNWNATKPLEIVCSDMTCLFSKGKRYEWTYILDTYNNEIIASSLSEKEGDAKPYFDCLEQLKQKIKEKAEPIILHTDQGSVYSSKAFFYAHQNYNIKRSMSRVGTPTDNAIIEAENGWIKAEMCCEGKLKNITNIYEFIKDYIEYFNTERPSWKLNYKTPIQYRIEQGFY